MVLRTVCSLQPSWRAIRGTPAPYSLAKIIWQRRTRQASAERRPAFKCRRSSVVTSRTKTEGYRMENKIPHFPQYVSCNSTRRAVCTAGAAPRQEEGGTGRRTQYPGECV